MKQSPSHCCLSATPSVFLGILCRFNVYTYILSLFLKKIIYLFLFMAVLGLRVCARAFSSRGKRGPLFIAVRRPLTIAASLVVEHRLQMRRLSNCGSWAQPLRGMWDLPGPGVEPVFPALAGRFSTTAPPGKPSFSFFFTNSNSMYFSEPYFSCLFGLK